MCVGEVFVVEAVMVAAGAVVVIDTECVVGLADFGGTDDATVTGMVRGVVAVAVLAVVPGDDRRGGRAAGAVPLETGVCEEDA